MDVSVTGAKILFTIPVLGGIKISETLVNTWAVMIVLTGLCIWLTRDLKVRNISKKQAVAEKIVMMAESLVHENMGEKWMHYVPFISAIFGLSIFSSLSSLLGLWAPTGDISTYTSWWKGRNGWSSLPPVGWSSLSTRTTSTPTGAPPSKA